MPEVWYALRRTLTHWNHEQGLAELIEFCKKNLVDEVILKIDSEEFTHAIPTPEWVDAYLPILAKAKKELNAEGIVFSLNPWVTMVHCDRGRDLSKTYPDIDLMVGHDGTRCTACCCVLSEGWRKATRTLWRKYASLAPEVIWIEDDIRLFNHQPVSFGCFCPLHMKAFGERVGRDVSREELIAAMTAPGKPHDYRYKWLDMTRDIMLDVAHFFEETVHSVSPSTHLGLMSSPPSCHALEGRDWKAFTSALAGDRQLVARPCLCSYYENSPRDMYESEYFLRSTLHVLGEGKNIQTEVDNWPFSIYSKSQGFTKTQMSISFIFGADGVTLNLFDHMGNSISDFPECAGLLKENKPFFSAIKDACYGGKSLGIHLIQAENTSYCKHAAPGADFLSLMGDGQLWRVILEPLGFPITFDDSPMAAVEGQVLRALSKQDIEALFSKGVLLDLCALETLIDMGYGDLAGADIKDTFIKNSRPIAAEEFFAEEFGGKKDLFMTLNFPTGEGVFTIGEILPHPRAEVISRGVDMDSKPLFPLLTIFKNRLGGRVAVYPINGAEGFGKAFLNPQRKRQMSAIINWLAGGTNPLEVSVRNGAFPLPFRVDTSQGIVAGAVNLSLDVWDEISLAIPVSNAASKSVEVLQENGEWISDNTISVTVEQNRRIFTIKKKIPVMDALILRLR